MLTNVVDERMNQHAWRSVWGVVEPTLADNPIEGADQADRHDEHFVKNIGPAPLSEILAWASGISDKETTLFIYDADPMCAKGTCGDAEKACCTC